jgi:hypothetical protein
MSKQLLPTMLGENNAIQRRGCLSGGDALALGDQIHREFIEPS